MKATPATRARRAAERELAALVAHTPCLGGLVSPRRGLFKFDVDLPFLAWDAKARAPRECRGFRLAVALPAGYPTAPPRVAFVSEETIFHPAVSPRLFAFCLGNDAWTPDVGAAHFVVLHLEAIVGLVDIDTLDGLFRDPLCESAASHYRELRKKGGLPLARPVFAMRARRAGAKHSASSPRPPKAARQRLDRTAAAAFAVRSPRGRRLVSVQDGEAPHSWTATCVLDGEVWGASAGPEAAQGLRWLGARLRDETDLRLVEMDGAPALRLTREGRRAPTPKELCSTFESALRRFELPISALADPVVARAVANALNDSQP